MNLSEMCEGYNNLLREYNEYVASKKPLVEMSNGKIVSGSKYIVIAAVLDRLEKEVATLEKKKWYETTDNRA